MVHSRECGLKEVDEIYCPRSTVDGSEQFLIRPRTVLVQCCGLWTVDCGPLTTIAQPKHLLLIAV